ncbi:ABC transporter permease [Halobacteriales archaeon QS_8_69_26]|nr:MAG: ABC transporter permease [Halobacteriales archaeon QS_8_69_26]
MRGRRYLLARLAWTVFAAWLVLSGTFFLFVYTPDPNENLVAFGAGYAAAQEGGNVTKAQQEAVEAYREARNYDQPIHQRYLKWVTAYATFDWGVSYTYGQPVRDVVLDRGYVTALYLGPAVLLSLLVGTLAGLFSATRRRSVLDYVGRSVTYIGLGLPNFWLAQILALVLIAEFEVFELSRWNDASPTSPDNVPLLAVAGIVIAVHLIAIQTRYARSETRELLPEPFVKTLRSTGASEVGVARHVLRNASVPLVSLLFTEVLVAVMVDVFIVEAVLDVPGLGAAAYRAIESRDIGLIIGTWMLPVFVVLAGTLLQDSIKTLLDPRLQGGD